MWTGPPGTGKTFVSHLLIQQTLEQGGTVLIRTARDLFGDNVDIGTFHAASGDGRDPYSLVLVDETFLLSEALCANLNSLHHAVAKVPCVVLAARQPWRPTSVREPVVAKDNIHKHTAERPNLPAAHWRHRTHQAREQVACEQTNSP